MAEYGIAKLALPGEGQSGDQCLVCCNESGILVAAIDGIGHGAEAANAAKAANASSGTSVTAPRARASPTKSTPAPTATKRSPRSARRESIVTPVISSTVPSSVPSPRSS